MFAVIFEVNPRPEAWDAYLGHAATLRPDLVAIEGFIANERYGLDPRTRKWIEHGYEAGDSGIFTDAPAGGPSRPR